MLRVPLGWRNVTHERGRAIVGVTGVAFAIMLMFLQLGFFGAVIIGATQIYDQLAYDVVIVSRDYRFIHSPRAFPRRRMMQAFSHSAVAETNLVYLGMATWHNRETGLKNSVTLIGIDPARSVFRNESINRNLAALTQSDTAIVDSQTRAKYGARGPGSVVEIGGRNVRIVDDYKLGTAFVDLAMLVQSDLNLIRLQPGRTLDDVGLGLITLKTGSDPDRVAAELRTMLPDDVTVYTRTEFRAHEVRHWLLLTSTGFIFGSGVVVAVLVGAVILYQTVSTQIITKLNEYATLKAIGYTPSQILRIVLEQAFTISLLGYLPGLLAALGLYTLVERRVFLPMVLSGERMALVLGLVLVMSLLSGCLAYRRVHIADPAELF